ncbi:MULTISPECIES: SepM family pheromone-processing serine protease [Enterococcus]|uniref:PDZ domain-containing protein n=1 Tax=Enterococcus alishanensis TaxID=1303817 RepID=A0ABS6TBJ3_9ENTE|nr:SepM family pheromone-processing serine protease [Enterococcus alishanensis]MBV7390271.1 PDZ domain-containing protein [Enterococcus alishanensis]
MKNKKMIKRIIAAVIAVLILACVVFPIPYYVESPGATINLKELIKVDNQADKQDGSFSLTSVGVRRATVLLAAIAQFRPFEEVISARELTGGSSDEEYNQVQQYYMESSQNAAIQQALSLAGKEYQLEYKGVYVLNIEKSSNFYGKIAVGDTITEADGQTFENTEDFMDYVKSQKVGQEMTITYTHDGKSKTVKEKLIELPSDKKAGIGITLTDHTEITSDYDVQFETENIGGPSAGLMFTLEIYEQISGENLRNGQKIAGTGTIDSEGTVGRIGGIDKKVASASADGAKIFFAPDDKITKAMKKADPTIKTNYQEAKAAAKKLGTDMKIVPVKTVKDALDYLAENK